jgi:spore germination protein YaaH
MKKIVLIFALLLTTAFATFLLLPPQIPLSPLGSSANPLISPPPSSPYLILGFAPYWNMKKLSPESLSSISHFAYFALHLRGDGTLYTHVNRREEDPGYTNYKRLLANPSTNKPLILTFMQEDQDALATILSSPQSRQNAITTIISSVNESSAAGINIDFEPLGDIDETARNNFTLFIEELRTQLDLARNTLNSKPLLTISTYASAAIKPRIWDLAALSPLTDYFVIMTYDYTMPKSDTAGPNSPLRDFSGEFEHNILKNLAELTTLTPSSKLLLGIPLYGYQWDTLDNSRYSPTTSRGITASLERIEQMLQDRTLELVWDRNSLTPYGVSTDSGTTSQIYFENETSLRLKLDLVRSANLGGIALWALGYDNNVPWLWPTIESLNK